MTSRNNFGGGESHAGLDEICGIVKVLVMFGVCQNLESSPRSI